MFSYIYNKSKIILILLLCCSGIYITKAMEQELPFLSSKTKSQVLRDAIVRGRIGLVKSVIKAGANVNGIDTGDTPLCVAACYQNKDIVKLLLDTGADVDKASRDGLTPLLTAVHLGDKEIVERLLDAKADPNRPDENGYSPFEAAMTLKLEAIIELLLVAGADVNAQNDKGETPLHSAVLLNKKNQVRFLLEQGANPLIKDYQGQTPADLAASFGHHNIANILKKAEREQK